MNASENTPAVLPECAADQKLRPAIDISVVFGTLNRLSLLKHSVESVRHNGFTGNYQMVAVDGGSSDGTVEWLAQQKDILTIVQPNYKVVKAGQPARLAHSWGEFMNIGFRACKGKWILMISDDLILCRGCIGKGFEILEEEGGKVGAGAFLFRDYPRDVRYHFKRLPGGTVLVNHGFFLREALEKIQFIDEDTFEFYAADGDLCMRLTRAGYDIVPLEGCLAEHLAHMPNYRRLFGNVAPKGGRDFVAFEKRWGAPVTAGSLDYSECKATDRAYRIFWRLAPIQCALSAALRFYTRLGLRS